MNRSSLRPLVCGLLMDVGLVATVHAQLDLLFDVNQTANTSQSSPAQFTQLGGMVLFSATSAQEGRELWKTDGTTGGTVLEPIRQMVIGVVKR